MSSSGWSRKIKYDKLGCQYCLYVKEGSRSFHCMFEEYEMKCPFEKELSAHSLFVDIFGKPKAHRKREGRIEGA